MSEWGHVGMVACSTGSMSEWHHVTALDTGVPLSPTALSSAQHGTTFKKYMAK